MSRWKDIKKEDIDIDTHEMEINVLVGYDYSGNKYVTLKIKDVKELIKEALEKEENNGW